MNAFSAAFGGFHSLAAAPAWAVLLLKLTAILSAAWLVHLALRRVNPRWRVFLWRVTAVGIFALPAIALLLPVLKIHLQPPPARETAENLPSPFGRGAGGEGLVGGENGTILDQPLGALHTPFTGQKLARNVHAQNGNQDPSALTLTLSQRERGPSSANSQRERGPSSANSQRERGPVSLALAQSETGLLSRLSSAAAAKITLLLIWLAGIAVLVLRLSIGHYRVWRMVRRAGPPPQWISDGCLRVARAVGCRSTVEVLQSADIQSPFLCGLRRPRLLLPARMCDDSYLRDLPGIFAHELTHVRGRDVAWNVGLKLISIALWFHPLVWRMRQVHLAACELVCDAASASFVGDVSDYCRTLARVAVDACALPAAGIAMARTSAITRRLNALKERVFDLPLRRRNVLGVGLAALLAVTVVGSLQFTLAAPPTSDPVAEKEKTQPKPVHKAAKPAEVGKATQNIEPLLVRVLDGAGKPIAGAKLHADCRGKKLDGVTDAKGRCELAAPGPNAGYIYLYATIEGYVPLRKYWTNQDDRDPRPAEFTYTFLKGRTIGGVVRDEQGRPIPDAKISLSISTDKYEKQGVAMALWDKTFSTDAEGRWHLDHVPEDIRNISIEYRHPDYFVKTYWHPMTDTELRQLEDRTAVTVMKRGIVVTGTVTDPEGKPVAEALVAQGQDRFGSHYPTTRTDREGHYRFGNLAPGTAVLTVVSPGLAPAIRNLNVEPGMKPVDFRLEKGHLLRLLVVDKDGHPLRGAFVSVDTWRGYRTLVDLGLAKRTDAEGRWSWSWAPKDAVGLQIDKSGYMGSGLVSLAAREKEHVVTLYPALTVSGRVIDAKTKQPIANFHAIHGYIPGGNFENKSVYWDRGEMVNGKNGRYKIVINRPSEGNYVRIEADGYQPATSRKLGNDEGPVTCDFSLSKGKILNVLVKQPDGKPAAGAEARLCPEQPGKQYNMATFVKNGRLSDFHDPTSINLAVGPDGRLPIEPQDNWFLLIVLDDRGFAKATKEELLAKPEITLEAWARLEGVVRHGTKPVPNAKLDVYPFGSFDRRWAFLNFQEQTETDTDGKFVFPKLKPGKWRVRLLPAERNARPLAEKTVELKPGQTAHVMFGGEGRPVVGQIQWPGGKPPEGDLSHIYAGIEPPRPEPPQPPKEVREKGPDAVRAWLKQWQDSDEGKAWMEKTRQRSQRTAVASVDADGRLRAEGVVPGQYELTVYVKAKEDTLPWERPEMLRYSFEFTMPEIPGGVSDVPLDLGTIALVDKTPPKVSFASVKPPPPMAPGEKTVASLPESLDLLRYVVLTYRQNKAKIKTWQGKATVESRQTYDRTASGQDFSANIKFVFDRAKKSIRWNDTLEEYARITGGQDEPQPTPQIVNGMMTPEGLYRLGRDGMPGNPAKRPLTLRIYPLRDSFGRLQPQNFDFNPLYYLDTSRGDVARDLSGYIGMANQPGLSRIKVIREGDSVTIDMSMSNITQRYTVSLSQGCNPVSYETIEPTWTWKYRWTYESVDGVWLPKTWTETVRQKGVRNEDRKVAFVENRVNQPVDPAAFSLPQLGLEKGDTVYDERTGQRYQYIGEN